MADHQEVPYGNGHADEIEDPPMHRPGDWRRDGVDDVGLEVLVLPGAHRFLQHPRPIADVA
eukprot:COSAG02_NODE_4244_length_5593_cov_2.391518_2_plen_61_part_00